MKQYFIVFFLIVLIFSFGLGGCQEKEDILDKQEDATVEFTEDAMLRQEMADIIFKITNDVDVIQEVSKAVEEEYYGEEAILLVDLLEENNSTLKSLSFNTFRSKFFKELKSNLKSASVYSETNLMQALKNGKVQLYWPYHEDWDGITEPTISFHDGINEYENVGYKCDGTEVLVNDEYAMNNPVWIINYKEFDGDYEEIKDYYSLLNKKKKAFKETLKSASAVDYITCQIKQAQCTEQTDGLFSGGPDIRYVRAGIESPYTKDDVTDWEFQQDFSRKDVKYKRWKLCYITWDTQWEKEVPYQVMVVYDYDKGEYSAKVTGKIQAVVSYEDSGIEITDTTNVEFSANYESKEPVIYCNDWGYFWARNNLGWAHQEGLGFVQTKWLNGYE